MFVGWMRGERREERGERREERGDRREERGERREERGERRRSINVYKLDKTMNYKIC
jgi:hypothetical protein